MTQKRVNLKETSDRMSRNVSPLCVRVAADLTSWPGVGSRVMGKDLGFDIREVEFASLSPPGRFRLWCREHERELLQAQGWAFWDAESTGNQVFLRISTPLDAARALRLLRWVYQRLLR